MLFFSVVHAVAQQPNILWIIADDLSPDLGAYGYDAVNTPNLDRLASEGVRYTNAFSTAPVCSSSRSALITGMYQTAIGAHSHRMTGNTKQNLPTGVSPITEYFRQEGYYVTNANSSVSGNGKTDYNFNSGVSGGMYDGFNWANRNPGQPFFAQVQIFQPHRDLLENKDFTRLNKVTFPSYYPDHPVTRADWANYLVSVEELDRKVGLILDRLENEGLADDTIVMFFGDHGRPHVRDKQWLYDGGLRVPLIIRDPTQTNAGAVNDDALSLIDVSVGSLALTGATLPSHLQGVNMFDPAFDGREAIFASRDRSGNVQDRVRSVQVGNLKLIRNYDPNQPYMTGAQESFYKRLEYPVHTLLLELQEAGQLTPAQAKLLASSRPPEELYDLANDPEELNNLIDDPAYASTVADLQGRLDTWVQQTDGAGRFPLDPAVESSLQQSSINWGTNQLANRGFAVNGDRTLELRWWEEKLGVQRVAVNSDETLNIGQVSADGLPANGGTITVAPFSGGGTGTSPSTGGVVEGIVEANRGAIVMGVGQITGHLLAKGGSTITIGDNGIATGSAGVNSSEDFEAIAAETAFTDGVSTGLLSGWSFIDLAPSTGTSTDVTFDVIATATDSRWTQSSARSQMLAQTNTSIDFLRENDTSGDVVGGALAIAGPGSGIDSSNAVDIIEADLFWGDALRDENGSFLDSKIVFAYQDPDNFLSLSLVKGQSSGQNTQIDIRAIAGGQVTDAFHATGTSSFNGNFPNSNAPANGVVHVKIIHDAISGFVFFELVDSDDPSIVYATASVTDPLLAVDGFVGFGVNNDAAAWDNLMVTTQAMLPASGLQVLDIGGNYVQENFAVLEIDLLSSTIFDQIQVAGNASLDGILDLSVIDPSSLSPGETFQIIDVEGELSGTFSGLPEGAFVGRFGDQNFYITYQGGDGNDVELTSVLPGDFDLDGDVDGKDFLEWQRGGSPQPYSQADLLDWRANFGGSGQASANAMAVPEPSAMSLLGFGLAVWNSRGGCFSKVFH